MNSVIKGAGYVLVHAPDMVIHNGSTQTTERIVNPQSEYLKELPNHLRTYEEVVGYLPNQTYIGSITPDELGAYESPWVGKSLEGSQRFGKFGEIMPQGEFLLLMQVCDMFDLVRLEKVFVEKAKAALSAHPLMGEDIISRVKHGVEIGEIEKLVNEEHAEAMYDSGALVGCVKRAHDYDLNLSSHVMHENLVSKASTALSILHLMDKCKMPKDSVDYVIECSEEACGDMNQRGGGNFAKAAAEIAGLTNASGSDCRGFCAAPTHAIILAASLVKAGTYENVVVAAGGATAKLGMNGKDHLKKGFPILEDVLGGFAVLISKNDGISPEIELGCVGRHKVGTGSSPQAVITSLVAEPLERSGLKITDVDKYSVEMQNPDVTKPAGAGDVPLANYKMIAALAVMKGEIQKADIAGFAGKYGMVGWAPTQGHIPSGIPYLGFAREDILSGKISRAMIVGKGSLFLGRMTNLFDGTSVIVQRNSGESSAPAGNSEVSEAQIKQMIAQALKDFAASLLSE